LDAACCVHGLESVDRWQEAAGARIKGPWWPARQFLRLRDLWFMFRIPFLCHHRRTFLGCLEFGWAVASVFNPALRHLHCLM
jgi:hypothetical protein